LRHYPIGVLVCTLAAAGFFAATRTPNANASHISYADLPGLGYQVSVRVDASQVPLCQDVWVIGGNNAPETRLGVPGGKAGCNTSLEFQAAVDALLVDYPPPVPTVTVTRTFVQPPDTVVMPAQTVTAAAVTVTQPARTVTAPAATVTLPAVTQTATETARAARRGVPAGLAVDRLGDRVDVEVAAGVAAAGGDGDPVDELAGQDLGEEVVGAVVDREVAHRRLRATRSGRGSRRRARRPARSTTGRWSGSSACRCSRPSRRRESNAIAV
jgi:hypothetical protein